MGLSSKPDQPPRPQPLPPKAQPANTRGLRAFSSLQRTPSPQRDSRGRGGGQRVAQCSGHKTPLKERRAPGPKSTPDHHSRPTARTWEIPAGPKDPGTETLVAVTQAEGRPGCALCSGPPPTGGEEEPRQRMWGVQRGSTPCPHWGPFLAPQDFRKKLETSSMPGQGHSPHSNLGSQFRGAASPREQGLPTITEPGECSG